MGVVSQGLNRALGMIFPTTPSNIWYIGLINSTPAPVLDSADTLALHPGWVEAAGGGVTYSGTRPSWTNGAPDNQQVTNASYVSFAMTTGITIYGVFLCDQVSGTTGTLFGTGPFVGGGQGVVSGDTLQITLTCSAASS
jgi:hypothetical protein